VYGDRRLHGNFFLLVFEMNLELLDYLLCVDFIFQGSELATSRTLKLN
jgi:hypothetical protein